jgi:cysteinyl-tRNA synthetase
MNDDFNSPNRTLFEGVRFINLLHDGKETLNAVDLDIFSNAMNAFIFDVGLEAEKTANNSNDKLGSKIC